MEKLSFKTLHENYNVIIPMLQRDYAYGRKNEEEKRDNFLKNLKKYLDESQPHELDFVYGSVDQDNNLKLLDGQQRITTLFLLHWYLALIKDSTGKHNFDNFKTMMQHREESGASKFSYKTRFSSTDFCDILVTMETTAEIEEESTDSSEKELLVKKVKLAFADKYSDIIADEKTVLSEVIKKEKWFLPHWVYDPTICGMLTMLDSIKVIFKADECAEYYYKLVEKGQLVFNFLNLDDFQLTDELYIKMNSRGRALTRFENLKSKLLPLYDEAKERAPVAYKKMLSKINDNSDTIYTDLRNYVAKMLDTKWTDVFWNEWLNTPNHDETPNVDDMMLCFISVLAINSHIIHQLNGSLSLVRNSPLAEEVNLLMKQKDAIKGITIKYDKLIGLFCENDYALLFELIDYFNIFNDNGKLKTYYDEVYERELFYHITNDYKSKNMEYERKAKVFAYIKYLMENPAPDTDHLKNWMKFVDNVCNNSYTLADRADTFGAALAGLNFLYCKDIAADLRKLDISNINVLDHSQIQEEMLKSQLSDNEKWKCAIEQAETKLSYFEGRLSFVLSECCNIDNSFVTNDSAVDKFCEYVNKIAAIFPNKNGCDKNWENSLIRALLSKGDYLMYFKSNNSFLQNDGRDNSWRRFLKEKPNQKTNAWHPYDIPECDIRCYFRELIEDPVFDKNDIKESLESIAQKRDDGLSMWRKLIIDYPDVLNNTSVEALGPNRFIRWNNETTQYTHKKDCADNYEIDLLYGIAITGYHAELFSLCKYYELRDKSFEKLGVIKYQRAKTNVEQPYFYYEKDGVSLVKVLYQDDCCFRFVFEDDSEKTNVAYADVENELLSI